MFNKNERNITHFRILYEEELINIEYGFLYSVTQKSSITRCVEALLLFENQINIITVVDIYKFQRLIQYEISANPKLFFVDSIKIISTGISILIEPQYIFSKQEVDQILCDCAFRSKKLLSKYKYLDTYSQIVELHDSLAKNVVYTLGESRQLHSIIGPFLQKQAVCEGFAKAFKFLLDQLEIPCIVVVGKAWNQLNEILESHAWNMVRLNGEWCHVDVTFDTTIRTENVLRYDYFGLTNEQILLDHEYEVSCYPMATSTKLCFYQRNGLHMETKSCLKKYLSEQIRKRNNNLIFKLPENVPERGLEQKVFHILEEVLTAKKKSYSIELNYNIKQKVFHAKLN